jgi:hypothetical protein
MLLKLFLRFYIILESEFTLMVRLVDLESWLASRANFSGSLEERAERGSARFHPYFRNHFLETPLIDT